MYFDPLISYPRWSQRIKECQSSRVSCPSVPLVLTYLQEQGPHCLMRQFTPLLLGSNSWSPCLWLGKELRVMSEDYLEIRVGFPCWNPIFSGFDFQAGDVSSWPCTLSPLGKFFPWSYRPHCNIEVRKPALEWHPCIVSHLPLTRSRWRIFPLEVLFFSEVRWRCQYSSWDVLVKLR